MDSHLGVYYYYYYSAIILCLDSLSSLPCALCNQVPFGPLAFMPGKLVHTNELTVLLGDNWFAKCSAKQAQKIIGHRMEREFVFKKIRFRPLQCTVYHAVITSSTRGRRCITLEQ